MVALKKKITKSINPSEESITETPIVQEVSSVEESTESLAPDTPEEITETPVAEVEAETKKPVRKVIKATKKEPKEKKEKVQPTVIDGMGYGLISRVRNAFPVADRIEKEKGSEMITMVDGRGTEHQIAKVFVTVGLELGGSEYLRNVRSAKVKTELRRRGMLASLPPVAKKEDKPKVEAKAEPTEKGV